MAKLKVIEADLTRSVEEELQQQTGIHFYAPTPRNEFVVVGQEYRLSGSVRCQNQPMRFHHCFENEGDARNAVIALASRPDVSDLSFSIRLQDCRVHKSQIGPDGRKRSY